MRVRSGRVQIDWPSKATAEKQADTLARTTSRDFETLAGNALIQGDNLDALKELRRVGNQQFKLTLIDPPYNTDPNYALATGAMGTITVVPEPSSFLFLGLIGVACGSVKWLYRQRGAA